MDVLLDDLVLLVAAIAITIITCSVSNRNNYKKCSSIPIYYYPHPHLFPFGQMISTHLLVIVDSKTIFWIDHSTRYPTPFPRWHCKTTSSEESQSWSRIFCASLLSSGRCCCCYWATATIITSNCSSCLSFSPAASSRCQQCLTTNASTIISMVLYY